MSHADELSVALGSTPPSLSYFVDTYAYVHVITDV